MVLCVLAMTVIAVPMMGLWNVSLTWLSSMAYVFSVLCVSGLVGNSLVMGSWSSACSMVLFFLYLLSPCLITWGCDHSPAAYFLHCILTGSCLSSWIRKHSSFSCFIRRLCPLSIHQGLDCLVAVDFSSEILLPGICLESFGPNTFEAHSWNACFDAPSSVGYNIGVFCVFCVLLAVGSVFALLRQKEVRWAFSWGHIIVTS